MTVWLFEESFLFSLFYYKIHETSPFQDLSLYLEYLEI